MKKQKLMLIDGNNILNRAFYGLYGANLLATRDGLFTNAVYGFINILFKYIEEEKPELLCVAFDLKAPTFRHESFEGYKAKRKGMPEELKVQVPVIKEVLDAMNIKRLEFPGYEADDIIGTMSFCAENKGMEVVIVSGDRDTFQLISENVRVKLPKTSRGKTETEEYDLKRIMQEYGILPKEFIDLKGLMGDTSDNIPGVAGIGEKTALELIKQFKTIENIYDNIEEVSKKGVREKLINSKDIAFMSKRLSQIDRNVPGVCDVEDLKRQEPDKARLLRLMERLEFKSLIKKFNLENSSENNELENTDEKERITKNVIHIYSSDGIKKAKNSISKFKKIYAYYLCQKDTSFTYKLYGIAISNGSSNDVYYIELNSSLNQEEFLTQFKDVFEDASVKKYVHDAKNLIIYLMQKNIAFNSLAFDTMIGAYLAESSDSNYSIPVLAQKYLNYQMEDIEELCGKGKKRISYGELPLEKLLPLMGEYSDAVYNLSEHFQSVIKQNKQEELYFNIELRLVEVLASMEYRGFKVDTNTLHNLSKQLEAKICNLTQEIYNIAGEEFNINSPKQLGTILFERLGLPVLKKTKTGYSTDVEVLEKLEEKHEIISKILLYRHLVKLKSTYADGLAAVINPATGKIHSSFNQTVTVTGRISSTEPNLQNIPIKLEMGREVRKAFVPTDNNYVLLDADYSQIELRVLAHITEDENMLEAFLNDQDIHTTTASKIFGVEEKEITNLMRSKAKAVNFGIVYGIGEFSLAEDLKISRKEAKKYIDEYLGKYPKVRDYMNNIVQSGKELGFVTTLFNRRRYLPELKASNFNVRAFGERVAMNTPIQGTAADIIKIAMVKTYSTLKEKGLKSKLILQVHDELIIETFKDEIDEVKRILKESMENAVELRCPLKVDLKMGNTWYETK